MSGTITALTAQKRNPNRINVYLDGEFAFGLTRIVAAWLSVGQFLDDAKIERLQKEDSREELFQKALHFLGYRPRTEKEIRQHLISKGNDAELVELVLAMLREKGFVNDLQFAKSWVENRNSYRPRGYRALTLELRQKGIDGQIIDEILSGQVNEGQLALTAARKYTRRLNSEDWNQFRTKLGAFLSRRGFSYETVSETVRQVWNEVRSPNEIH